MRQEGGWRCSMVRTHGPGLATQKQEEYHHHRGSLQGVRGLSPTLVSTAWGPAPRRRVPRTPGFEGKQGCVPESQAAIANRDSTLKEDM